MRVVATLKSKPEHIDALKAILTKLAAETRKESGNISYELLQRLDQATEFVTVEEWAGADALDAHMQTEHIKTALSAAEAMFSDAPMILRYAKVG